MDIEPERCVAFSYTLSECWRERWVHRARRLVATGPDGARRQKVGQIVDVDKWASEILCPVARQASQECINRVQRFNAGDKTQMIDRFFDLLRGSFELGAIFAEQHNGT